MTHLIDFEGVLRNGFLRFMYPTSVLDLISLFASPCFLLEV